MNNAPQQSGERSDMIGATGEAVTSGLKALAPADKSWIAGFIVVVAIIVISDAFIAVRTLQQSAVESNNTRVYFELIEANRANELRRAQETIKALSDAVARDSERAGMAALTAIETESEIRSRGTIGPQLPEGN